MHWHVVVVMYVVLLQSRACQPFGLLACQAGMSNTLQLLSFDKAAVAHTTVSLFGILLVLMQLSL